MQSILIVLLAYPVYSQVLVAYNFYENYGSTFYDFSGNYRHAVNGNSPGKDTQDTLPTDRGAYYSSETVSGLIEIPNDDAEGKKFSIKNSFSIHLWVNLQKPSNGLSGFIIFERVEDEKGLVIFYDFDNGFQIKSSDSSISTGDSNNDNDSDNDSDNDNDNSNDNENDRSRKYKNNSKSDKSGINDIYKKWFLLSIKIHKNKVEILDNRKIQKTDDFSYSDSENSETYIGGKPSKSISIVGFIWNFVINGIRQVIIMKVIKVVTKVNIFSKLIAYQLI